MAKVENRPDVLDAIEEITGCPAHLIRSAVGEHPETGNTVYAPGYKVHEAGFLDDKGLAAPMVTIENEKGQTIQIPAHRIAELRPSKSAKKTEPTA